MGAPTLAGIEFVESGELMGIGMHHLAGGPRMAFRLDPERAAAAAGFDHFSIGVADEVAIRALADRFTALGDAHEVRFYTVSSHSEVPPSGVVHDPRETAGAREATSSAS